MNALLCFTKIAARQNILYDEFFLDAAVLEFIAFNCDGKGGALCRCDGTPRLLDYDTVNKILFGVPKERLDSFIRGIYDPKTPTHDLVRIAGRLTFRLVELNEVSKYSLGNLAKQTHKGLQDETEDPFRYFVERRSDVNPGAVPRTALLHGNTGSRLFHRSDCKYYESKDCTARFVSREEAVAAGYKPCKLCD